MSAVSTLTPNAGEADDVIPHDTSEEFVTKAVPLIKEYATKLQKLKAKLRRICNEFDDVTSPVKKELLLAEFDALDESFDRLEPAVRRFAQQVSGMIDQGKLTPLNRVELQLRLAELESQLVSLPNLIRAYQLTFSK